MKRRIKYIFSLLLLLEFNIVCCAETKHCLFIGDSYFSHNDLSGEFLSVWQAEISSNIKITNHNRNGATLVSQWDNNPNEIIQVIQSRNWDYIIIELPLLAAPDNSNLCNILSKVDSLLINCKIICVTMDFCNTFPEMACSKDEVEGVICNKFDTCNEKLNHIKLISDKIQKKVYNNTLKVIPFSHYRYYLHEKFYIELGSDDEYGHPSTFSQKTLARFIIYHIINNTSNITNIKTKNTDSMPIHILSFYRSFQI